MTVAAPLQAIDAAWLSDVLGTPATNVSVEPVAFTGATTDLARVRYDGGSLVAKIRGTREVQRQMDAAMELFAREARFYAELADAVPVRTPRCYFSGDGDTTPLLLEDLDGLRMGDQMTGLSIADAETMMDALADLHAAFWGAPPDWLLRNDEGTYPMLVAQLVASGAPALQERYADRVSADVLAGVAERAPHWQDVLARASEGPPTLVHNDCRSDNIFFAADGTPCLIDWQAVSRTRGTQDVANLLAGSMDAADLSREWERLLRRWHERLVERGVSDYSFDEAVQHYRQNVFYPLGAGMALIGDMDIGDGRGLGDAILVRCLSHIAEVDALGAL
jgi:aminoglycoside/choline kinase family phosphotransferase